VEKVKYADIINRLKTLSNTKTIEGMVKYGITPESTYGVSIPNLRKTAKEIGVNHALAKELWTSNIRETRILASMIADPKIITEEQMERWVKDFDYLTNVA